MRWPSFFLALACLGYLSACSDAPPQPVEIAGKTMGTTWSVKIVPGARALDGPALQRDIDRRLDDISHLMSTYDPESELMRINRNPALDCIAVSAELAGVIGEALRVSRLSGGGFDVTVGPLVNLWGFGPEMAPLSIPSNAEIAAAMERIGYDKLSLSGDCLRKQRPDLFIDLSAIAKGYAVDEIAELLADTGFDDYMVEIGGEIRAQGERGDGSPWRIGVEKPISEQRAVHKIIPLSNLALATSGDYRNYFERDGVRYSHIIDASSGRPIRHNLVSVTVAHESCMVADALATAFMVLGRERALEIAEREGLAVMAIVKQDDALVEVLSKQFETLIEG